MESLNTDTLLLIGAHLPSPSCHSAIFVNSTWHDLFSRSLYRTASIRNLSQLQSFLKQILLRPELARVVRELRFGDWIPTSPEQGQAVSSLSEDDLALFSTQIKQYSHSIEEQTTWETDLLNNNDEAWIALLLSSTPNIQNLDLIFPSSLNSKGYLDRLFQRATGDQNVNVNVAFRRLSHVSLRQVPSRPEEDGGVFSMEQIMPFLKMRELRGLSVDSLVEYTESESEPEAELEGIEAERTEPGTGSHAEEEAEAAGEKEPTNSLQSLSLTTSNGAKGLSELLSTCTGLQTFKYQHSDAHCLSTGFPPSLFRSSLSKHKNTLQTLWLDNLGEHLPFTISGLNESCDQWFGSFSEFTALKELRVRLTNLLNVQYDFEPGVPLKEVLPGGIEELRIEECKERSLGMLSRQIEGLLELRQKEKKFQGLKRVSVEGCFHDDEDTSGTEGGRVIKESVLESVQPLKEACEDAGVDFGVWDRMCRV